MVSRVKAIVDRIRGKNHTMTDEEQEENEQAEIARNLWKNYRIFPPTSPLREQWNKLMLYLVLYNCLQIPLSLAFTFEEASQQGLDNFDVVVDALFGIDILLNLRTTYYEEEEIVTDWKKAMKRYLYSWYAGHAP